MTDHRRLQRTLFRMYLDEGFARDVIAGMPAALDSTGLNAEDQALLTSLDPRALAADPGGRRRSQFLGNSASEFTLSLAAARAHPKLDDWLDGFRCSPEFHDTLRTDGRLPLAFGNYAVRRALAARAQDVQAMLQFELAMAHWRRPSPPPHHPEPPPSPGVVPWGPAREGFGHRYSIESDSIRTRLRALESRRAAGAAAARYLQSSQRVAGSHRSGGKTGHARTRQGSGRGTGIGATQA